MFSGGPGLELAMIERNDLFSDQIKQVFSQRELVIKPTANSDFSQWAEHFGA
jgi:DNA replication protein DnaC